MQQAAGHTPDIADARALRDAGRLADARDAFDVVTKSAPERAGGWAGLAQAEADLENWQAARAAWQQALALAAPPAPEGWLLGHLRTLAALRETRAARAAAATLLHHHPACEAGRNTLLRLLADARDRAAITEEAATGALRDGPALHMSLPHFRALIALEDHAAARRLFDRLLGQVTTAAQLHMLFERSAICFGEIGRAERWRRIAARLAALPAGTSRANGPEIRRTLHLRLAIALRDYTGFRTSWQQGGETLPAWTQRFAALAARLSAPAFPDSGAAKIFGIGLSKTGTTTLAAALSELGYETAHFRNPFSNTIIDLPDFDLFDALNDGPVSAIFEKLYDLYPNARFIYTTRPFETWQHSVRGHRQRSRGSETQRDLDRIVAEEGPDSPLAPRLAIHDSIWRHPDLATTHAVWDQRVRGFFAAKPPGKLLEFSVFAGQGWPELCAFLGRPLPAVPFPHANRGLGG